MNDIYIYPTDTVWGIGCLFNDEKMVQYVHQIKGVKKSKNLSLLFPSYLTLIDWIPAFRGISKKEVTKLFSGEVTYLIDFSQLSYKVPSFIVGEGHFLGCRYLGDHFEALFPSAPIVTTSLNITQNPPITSLIEAKKFHEKYLSKAHFIDLDYSMSGRSSSIVKISSKLELIRPGLNNQLVIEYAQRIKKIFSA